MKPFSIKALIFLIVFINTSLVVFSESNTRGIGIKLKKENGKIYISDVFKASSAYNAGLRQGDIIIEIDKEPITNNTVEQVAEKIKGKKNTIVDLLIKTSDNKDVTYRIERNFDVEIEMLIENMNKLMEDKKYDTVLTSTNELLEQNNIDDKYYNATIYIYRGNQKAHPTARRRLPRHL